jgi:hypothetical protein
MTIHKLNVFSLSSKQKPCPRPQSLTECEPRTRSRIIGSEIRVQSEALNMLHAGDTILSRFSCTTTIHRLWSFTIPTSKISSHFDHDLSRSRDD